MRSPREMRRIQIEITNACSHRCSNCTRFCGHHKTPFFMDFDTFKRAVDSLDGWVGTIGIMGGEPTLHPEFARFVEYLALKKPSKQSNPMIYPQEGSIMDATRDMTFENTFPYPRAHGMQDTIDGPGLWSCIAEGYKKNYELIQDTIHHQVLNDHVNSSYHQPGLLTRRELCISDEEWIPMRDKCWVQNMWSASITPKGAFFCEIAAALDMTFNGPGGWRIEPGWWLKRPEEFGEQLNYCEMCGFACKTFMRDANEGIDDVSPFMYKKLKEIESPKLQKNCINVLKIDERGTIAEESKASGKRFSPGMPYAESVNIKINEKKTSLRNKYIAAIYMCESRDDVDAYLKKANLFDKVHILVKNDLISDLKDDVPKKVSFYDTNNSLGYVLYNALNGGAYDRYALVVRKARISDKLLSDLRELVLNPGTLLYADTCESKNEYFDVFGNGSECALINGNALSVRRYGWDKMLGITSPSQIRDVWIKEKVIELCPSMKRQAPVGKIFTEKKYVVFGGGGKAISVVKRIRDRGSEVVAIVDSDERKWGKKIGNVVVQGTGVLKDHSIKYDYIFISSDLYYASIKKTLLEMGFEEKILTMPFSE